MDKHYLISAHHLPLQLGRLIKRLDDGCSNFCIHVDSRSDIRAFRKATAGNRVHFIRRRTKTMWGNYSPVEAALQGIREVLASNQTGVIILMSGQDYSLAATSR